METLFSPNLTPPYRAQYGSADPARIFAPSILATAVSTLAAVVFCKVMDRNQRR